MNINDSKTFKSIILMDAMISKEMLFATSMDGDDAILEPLFIELLAHNYVSIVGNSFNVTDAGVAVYDTFMKRYPEYLRVFDIYGYVDTAVGEFAFEKFFDFNTDAEWDVYKAQQRFFDVRIAVANFKKMNPYEIVFMSFINENRFDTSRVGWQKDLMSDNVWIEIDNIVMTAIKIEDLGEDVMENMINRGTEVMMKILEKEIEVNKAHLLSITSNTNVIEEEVIEITTVIEEYEDDYDYYDPYWDPWYCSPIWFMPLFIW